MGCPCEKHRRSMTEWAEDKQWYWLASIIRRIPTHDERMEWLRGVWRRLTNRKEESHG